MIVTTGCILLCFYLIQATVNGAEIDSNACLKAHNDKRKLHGAKPLEWDATLAEHASDRAKKLAKLGTLNHVQGTGEGEILFMGFASKSTYDCPQAVQWWYGQVKDYPFDNPPKTLNDVPKDIGHFTQIVWKSTTKVGVGLVSKVNSKGGQETYIVARYSPPGNCEGHYAANVGKHVTPRPRNTGAAPSFSILLLSLCSLFAVIPLFK